MSLRQKTLTGLSWSVVNQVGRQVITFTIGVILARLLSPEEFGLVAMVTIITGFASLFAELGFGAAIIQKKEIIEKHLSSVFWLNVFSGLILTFIFIAGSGLVANFYGKSIIQPIAAVLSFNFLISSTVIVQRSLYRKSIDFKSLSIIKISASLLSGCVAVYMAFKGFGVWSLVWKSLLNTFFEACLLWFLSTWKPKIIFSWKHLKELLGFSLNLLGSRVLNYSTTSIDDLLIGKILGSSSLGNYTKAYALMQMPMSQISKVISRVMFPTFSSIQSDKEKIANVYLKMTRVIALITFPLMVGLFVLSNDFVMLVFGSQWSGMIPLVQIFCVLGMSKSIGTLVGNLYLSQGRADLQMRVGAFIEPIKIGAIVVGLYWGIKGVAIAYTVACVFAAYPSFYYAGKLVGLTWVDLIRNLYSIFVSAILMGVIVYFSLSTTPNYFAGFIAFLIHVILGIFSYWCIISLFNIRAYKELLLISKNQILKK